MTTIAMNGVSATLTFHKFDDFYRWELVLTSGENYAKIDGILDDSKHSLKFNGEEAKLEFHEVHWKLLFGVLEEGDLLNEFDMESGSSTKSDRLHHEKPQPKSPLIWLVQCRSNP